MAEGGTGSTVTEQEWFGALDDETKGYMVARGLEKKDPHEALLETIKAHRNAEARLGAPADEMFRWKKDDPDLHKKVFEKLGVPGKPEEYTFAGVKKPDGATLDADSLKFYQEAAHKAGVLPGQAEAFVSQMIAREAELASKSATDERLKVAVGLDQLKANWGPNYENNTFIANRALDLLGLNRDVMNVLSEHSSFPAVMDGLLKIGRSMGETKLLGLGDGGGSSANKSMTAEEAADKKASLMADREWVKSWGAGNKDAIQEIENLNKIIVAAHQRGYSQQVAGR